MSETWESVLEFWFGDDQQSPEAVEALSQRWFAPDPAFDAAIRERFADLPERAASGELDDWQAAPRSCLAFVLVVDQFPRNLHRDDARAFAYDACALRAVESAIARGFDAELTALEAGFLYLPLEHAEDLAQQDRCLEHYRALLSRAPSALAPRFQAFFDYALQHRRVIERFGRFPHRNRLLGRETTDEEAEYLESGGETFGSG